MLRDGTTSSPPPGDDAGRPRALRSAGVADGWGLVRHGVEAQIRRAGLRINASTATFHELAGRLDQGSARATIDLVVVGSVPDMAQQRAVERLAARGLPVVALCERPAPAIIVDLCSAGAHAVVSRDATHSELEDALRSISNGRRYIGPSLLAAAFDRHAPQPARASHGLTPRECDVLRELAAGATNDEIAGRLHIGSQTVKSHLSSIYDKLGVRRRSLAVRVALSQGLI